ncbi:MAG: hypothetical protein RBT15_03475 [Gudongella sp.]|jgi:hypothetical protein|nr:hypothetical protein [Gudongella sp.]
MPMPDAKMKINKDGVKFTSRVDAAQYTIRELTRAALGDIGRLLRYEAVKEFKLVKGVGVKQARNVIQYWNRSKETDLEIGYGNTKKNQTGKIWYAIPQELGINNQPKKARLRNLVYRNIPNIIKIQSQYLSALNDEARAMSLIDEEENSSDREDE